MIMIPDRPDMTSAVCRGRKTINQGNDRRTSGPVNAHLISWPSKAQNIQNLENVW